MASTHLRRVGALVFALALALSACGGGSSANDPAGVVQAAYAAVSSGGISKIQDYVCAAKKGNLASLFGESNMAQLTAAGVNPDELFGAMSVSFANVAVTQTAKTDTSATVTVTGDTTVTFDQAKFRNIMKTILAAQGQPTDDATLDKAMALMAGQLTQTRKMNDTVQLTNEGGKWLICG